MRCYLRRETGESRSMSEYSFRYTTSQCRGRIDTDAVNAVVAIFLTG